MATRGNGAVDDLAERRQRAESAGKTVSGYFQPE